MAGSLSKHEELLQLIPDLQCHVCKNVPGPSRNEMNRYSCTKAAHTLCEEHNTECVCGSNVGESPSPVIAKLLKNLPWMCQNYKTGCLESKVSVEDLKHHQEICIYRQVLCLNCGCNEEGEVLFKDLIDHLEVCMEEPIAVENMLNGDANNFLVLVGIHEEIGDDDYWLSSKMTSTCGAVFFTSGYVRNETVYLWLWLLGSSEQAKKYRCTYSIKNEMRNENFIYSGPVHTLDKRYEDIIASGSLLVIGVEAAKRSRTDEKKLEVEITIKNLKEEAKDEGVSDGE